MTTINSEVKRKILEFGKFYLKEGRQMKQFDFKEDTFELFTVDESDEEEIELGEDEDALVKCKNCEEVFHYSEYFTKEELFEILDHANTHLPSTNKIKSFGCLPKNLKEKFEKKLLKEAKKSYRKSIPTSEKRIRQIQTELKGLLKVKERDVLFMRRVFSPRDLDVDVFISGISGFGLKTNQDIGKQQFIMTVKGELIHAEEWIRRHSLKSTGDNYFVKFTNSVYLDLEKYGNLFRFVNHSCTPNCGLYQFLSKKEDEDFITYRKKEMQLGLFSYKKIEKGTELTMRYSSNSGEGLRCRCRPGCSKRVI